MLKLCPLQRRQKVKRQHSYMPTSLQGHHLFRERWCKGRFLGRKEEVKSIIPGDAGLDELTCWGKELPKKVSGIPNNTKSRSVLPSLNSCSEIAGLKRGLKEKDHYLQRNNWVVRKSDRNYCNKENQNAIAGLWYWVWLMLFRTDVDEDSLIEPSCRITWDEFEPVHFKE